ncbi:MAG: CAP domain-containing protein [Bryobacteraceae bacterium]|nr:CAP domain-containing protein [Bryobacteraceae bacterium]
MTRRSLLAQVLAAAAPGSLERRIQQLVSAERERPLVWEDGLARLAREHSEYQASADRLSHEDAQGRRAAARAAERHRTLIGGVGENICVEWRGAAATDESVAQSAVRAWMTSAGHRANILKPQYTHAAVGVAESGKRVYVTQVFAIAEGFLARPLPLLASPDETLDLTLMEARGPVDYVDIGGERRAYTGSFPLMGVPPGSHRPTFWFRERTGRWRLVAGPALSLKSAVG